MANTTLKVRAGDTEPIQLFVSGKRIVSGVLVDLENLDDLHAAYLYLRLRDAAVNEVDGWELTVGATALSLIFDPVGAALSGGLALATAGTYDGYIKCLWADGDETRHPGDEDLHVVARGNYE